MNFKMTTGEDFTIQTKGGYTLTAPDKTGTLATVGDVPSQNVEIIEIQGNPWELAEDPGSLPSGTYAQVQAAIQSGKSVILRFELNGDSYDFNLNWNADDSASEIRFVYIYYDEIVTLNLVYDDSFTFLTAGFESASNKVTSLSSSSTNTQYPSAKCVYDSISAAADTSLTTSEIDTIWNNAS